MAQRGKCPQPAAVFFWEIPRYRNFISFFTSFTPLHSVLLPATFSTSLIEIGRGLSHEMFDQYMGAAHIFINFNGSNVFVPHFFQVLSDFFVVCIATEGGKRDDVRNPKRVGVILGQDGDPKIKIIPILLQLP